MESEFIYHFKEVKSGGAKIAVKKDPEIWTKAKADAIKKFDNKFSARSMQYAVKLYKDRGGRYEGRKPIKSNQNNMVKWTREDWGTKSGKKSRETGERYLPKKVRDKLSNKEYKETTKKKIEDTKKGKQWSKQPKKISDKVSKIRNL